MKTLLAAALLATLSTTAFAQAADPDQPPAAGVTTTTTTSTTTAPVPAQPECTQAQPCVQPAAAYTDSQPVPTLEASQVPPAEEDGWHKPVGRRFMHGFRLGWTYIYNTDKMNRIDDNGMPTSLAKEFGIKSPNMMLLGYEGFYRIVGHSWLNVLMVGNVTVAGLEQSKFIPAASGLLGFEFNRSFQLGVGVNLTPDPEAPSHMIAAAGWTPMVGSIQTPLHFFFVPDTEGNHRMGATIGMTW
jgi:hypothetical protein